MLVGVRQRSGVGGDVFHVVFPFPGADIIMPDTRRTFLVFLVTSQGYMGLTFANDEKPAISGGTRISCAHGEWVQETRPPSPGARRTCATSPKAYRPRPARLPLAVAPLVRSSKMSPPPTAMLCSPIVPTLTPPWSTTAATLTTMTTTTRMSNSHSRRRSTSSNWGTTTSSNHSRQRSTSAACEALLGATATSAGAVPAADGTVRLRAAAATVTIPAASAPFKPCPVLFPFAFSEHLCVLRPRCIC